MSEYNGFKKLGSDLWNRTIFPLNQFTYCVYMIIGALLFGGFGVWYELLALIGAHCSDSNAPANLASLRTALLTFSPAIIGSAALQFLFEQKATNPLKAFAILMVATVFVALTLSTKISNNTLYFIITTLCAVIALWVCWLANAYNQDFMDHTPITAPTGGDLDQPPAGNIPPGMTY